MRNFVVRVSYDWVVPTYRDIEIDAPTARGAIRAGLERAHRDPGFWTGAIECDGDAGATTAVTIDPDDC